MMDESQIQFCLDEEEKKVDVVIEEQTKPKPFIPLPPTILPPQPFIPVNPQRTPFIASPPTILPQHLTNRMLNPAIVVAHKPFAYASDHQVPWKYECEVSTQIQELTEESRAANITGVGGMIRSGRCYARPVEDEIRKGKGKANEVESVVSQPLRNKGSRRHHLRGRKRTILSLKKKHVSS